MPTASKKSSSREESASAALSAVEKMLGENVACVNRAAEDLSSSEARIAVFKAVDCFTFLTGILGMCAMEKKAAVEGESRGGAEQGRRRRRCGDLGRSVEARSITATVRSRAAYKASPRGAVAPPFRWEQKPRKRSSLAVSSRWAQSGPTGPSRVQRSSLNRSTPDPGARLYIVNDESHAQGEGRVLGPLWPTSLAIASAALAARAAGTMPGGYCRNSGTWSSPDDAKVEPTPLVPPED